MVARAISIYATCIFPSGNGLSLLVFANLSCCFGIHCCVLKSVGQSVDLGSGMPCGDPSYAATHAFLVASTAENPPFRWMSQLLNKMKHWKWCFPWISIFYANDSETIECVRCFFPMNFWWFSHENFYGTGPTVFPRSSRSISEEFIRALLEKNADAWQKVVVCGSSWVIP